MICVSKVKVFSLLLAGIKSCIHLCASVLSGGRFHYSPIIQLIHYLHLAFRQRDILIFKHYTN